MHICYILLLCFAHICASEQTGSRIIGGDVASANQFPYVVAVQYVRNGAEALCGGSILNPRWILTAAHCVVNTTQISVYIGTTRIDQISSSGLILNSTVYVAHPQYDSSTLENNLGVIYLPSSLTFSNSISAIELPSASIAAYQTVTAVGWGATSDASTSYSSALYHVQVATITQLQCTQYYQSNLRNNMFCTLGTSGTQGTCRGDSGGPLIQFDGQGNAVQVGVAIFHSGNGCEAGHPSGFVRTFEYADWIRNVSVYSASNMYLCSPVLLVVAVTMMIFSL